MKPIKVQSIDKTKRREWDDLYRQTKKVRVRTRAQMILLAAEQGLSAAQMAQMVRQSEQTVRRWIKRYKAEGTEGLFDAPRPGSPGQVTPAYKEKLIASVRRRPRSLD